MSIKNSIPNFVTCCSLISGCIACIMALRGNLPMATLWIVIAAVFDFGDGFAARSLHAYSPMGKELDSLSDGRFRAAYLPKSSTENERSAVVITTRNGVDVLARQIAGALARRIVTYAKVGDKCHVDEQMGFIKFGSRVDVYLPVGTEVLVEMDQKVTGNQTPIARLGK